jgi:glycosyltransferase involved in cell wall biosynthesis
VISEKLFTPHVRLLVLTESSPEAICHGIGLRAHHLLRRLSHSYEISYLTADQFVSPKPSHPLHLRRLGSCFQIENPYRVEPELQRAFDCALREQSFDAIIVMGANMLHYAEHCSVPVIADLVDEPVLAALREIRVQGLSANSLRMAKHVLELFPYLRRLCHKARHCILVSEQDARWLRRIVHGVSVSVLPNGVDSDFFHPSGLPVNSREIVFSGIMGFPPNIAAAQYFACQIFPKIREALPECQWSIVGGAPSPEVQALAGPNIRVTGFVPDIRPYLEQAAVIISPLVSGGGMKNKILEAWAMGKAVVATPLGCTGIDVRDGVNLLLARNAGDFAAKTIYLMTHPEKAREIGCCARQAVAAHYAWDEKSLLLDRILQDVLSGPGKCA